MRIGDWSSDLCSSDLAGAGQMENGALIRATYSRSHRAKSGGPSGQELCRGVSRLRSTRTEREVERLGSEVQIPSPTLFDATSARLPSLGPSTCFEIGRASCRERGGPDV